VDYVRVFVPVIDANPHLKLESAFLNYSIFASVATTGTLFQGGIIYHLSECAQSRQYATSNPGAILPLWGCKDFNPHVLNCQSLNLVQQPVPEALS
jgi:hypothetical protein